MPVPGKRTLTEQLRLKAPRVPTPGADEAIAAKGIAGTAAPFPYQAEIEASFGRPLGAVAHTDDAARQASAGLGAEGFAYGGHVAFASERPSLLVAAHEAAHTMQDAGAVQRYAGGENGDAFEAHADAVASRVVRGESAADLLGAAGGPGATGVRRFGGDGKEVKPRPDEGAPDASKDDSARFGNDVTLDNVSKGAAEVKQGDRGVDVTKVQQALIDLYGTNYGGAPAFPAMTHAGGNLVDQWDDEVSRNAVLSDAQKKKKAREKVEYLIDSNCKAVNKKHSAVPSNSKEKAILKPIIDDFVSDKTKIQTMLELDIGWDGAQLEGTVYLQRYKSQNPDKDKAKEENRVQMWELFQTCIHEYIHTLAHHDYQTWAQTFRDAGDNTRYNTLIEGFCDFFTLNVRKAMTVDAAIAAKVEGPYANGNPPANVTSGVYPSNEQAEQVVSIVGIKNAQAGYFNGKIKLMGAP